MEKPTVSFRLDPHLIKEAKISGINLAAYIEACLARLMREKKCPYCGEYKQRKAGKR